MYTINELAITINLKNLRNLIKMPSQTSTRCRRIYALFHFSWHLIDEIAFRETLLNSRSTFFGLHFCAASQAHAIHHLPNCQRIQLCRKLQQRFFSSLHIRQKRNEFMSVEMGNYHDIAARLLELHEVRLASVKYEFARIQHTYGTWVCVSNSERFCTNYDWFIINKLRNAHQIRTMCPRWWCWLRLRRVSSPLRVFFSQFSQFYSVIRDAFETEKKKWQIVDTFRLHTWNWDAVMWNNKVVDGFKWLRLIAGRIIASFECHIFFFWNFFRFARYVRIVNCLGNAKISQHSNSIWSSLLTAIQTTNH